ncbi:hypothetical protein [Streptomyces sp. NPDC047071]|uniref:hypothetical protein n=1 Tax=Streptomyces sp. NPDC047071 TaxID=3154808 RepID=UPI0034552643
MTRLLRVRQSLQMLTRASQNRNKKLREVAADLVSKVTGAPPPPPRPLRPRPPS